MAITEYGQHHCTSVSSPVQWKAVDLITYGKLYSKALKLLEFLNLFIIDQMFIGYTVQNTEQNRDVKQAENHQENKAGMVWWGTYSLRDALTHR